MTEEVEFPAYNINNIRKRRDRLYLAIVKYKGHIVKGDVYHTVVDLLHQNLPDNIMRSTVEKSVRSLLNKTLTKELAFQTAWRLAANTDQLLLQQPVVAPIGQLKPEWMLAQVTNITNDHQGNRFAYRLHFQILAGNLAGTKVYQSWSTNKCFYLATVKNSKGLGFGFGKRKYNKRGEQVGSLLFITPQQYYGLRCYLLIEGDNLFQPKIKSVGHSVSTASYNKKLITSRDRAKTDCLLNLPNNPECHTCPLGENNCRVALRPMTLVTVDCPRCSSKALRDPMDFDQPDLCIKCAETTRKELVL